MATSTQNLNPEDQGDVTTGSGSTINTNTGQSGSNPAGTTQSGRSNISSSNKNKLPGRRLQNPLANFSSYTYTITLYIMTPDAYDAFNASRRQNINALNDAVNGSISGGAYILMQSGGINSDPNQKTTSDPGTANTRAPGFGYDYYIDDLRIKTATNAKSTQTMTNITELNFNIYEPYGFSFLTNLNTAVRQIQAYSKAKGYTTVTNPLRQIFVLGIRFQGYDKFGNVLTGKEAFAPDTQDPGGNSSGVFERFYDILIKKINFKIDGKTTVYSVQAVSLPTQVAFSVKRGMVANNTSITADTVQSALDGPDGLLTKMNNEQTDLLNSGKIGEKITYRVRFDGLSQEIALSSLKSKTDRDKSRLAYSKVNSVKDVNPKLEAKSIPNLNQVQITFKDSTPVMQAISSIIVQSDYLEKALSKVYYDENETPPNDEGLPNPQETEISWYNLSADVSNARWDSKQNDYVFDITYVIQKYETPIVQAAYIKKLPRYYGPHKRYDYWFTGLNSEIINYEQVLDTAYFNVAIEPNAGIAEGSAVDIPYSPNMRQSVNRLGSKGDSLESNNAYITWLVDPGKYARAKIQIMGDPDYLMNEYPGKFSEDYSQFYGLDGYTINPNGGQVFIEINFLEAVDYNNSTGTLKINDRIILWKYPKVVQEQIDSRGGGISYMILYVISNFRGGKFVQELDLSINTFADIEKDAATVDAGRNSTQSQNGANDSSNIAGLQQDPPASNQNSEVQSVQQASIVRQNNTGQTNGIEVTINTRSGPVANDEATGGDLTPSYDFYDPGDRG